MNSNTSDSYKFQRFSSEIFKRSPKIRTVKMVNKCVEELLNEDDCYKILKKLTKNPITIINYRIEKVSDKIVGFLGDHFRVIIKYSIKTNNCDYTVVEKDFFMKTPPLFNQSQSEYVKKMDIFHKEALVHKNLLCDLIKIGGKQFAPYCYHIDPDKCIVMENLLDKGYKMVANDYLNMEYGRSVMTTLARFHATTLIYEEINSLRLNEKFDKELEESTFSFVDGHPRQKWLKSSTNCLIDCLKLIPELNINIDEICSKLHKFIYGQLPEFLKPSRKYRNVLCHDDLWCNNMMFNQDLDCVIVDFQLVRYVPAANDVLLTIFMNFKRDFIDENFIKLIDIYYQTIITELQRYSIKSDIFPKDEFLESLEFYKLFSLIESAMFGTNTYISSELSDRIVSDFDNFQEFTFINRSKFIVVEFQKNQQFRERMMNVLMPIAEILSQVS